MDKIVLIGAGGHAKSVIDTIFALKNYEIVGIIDRIYIKDLMVSGVPIIGSDDDLIKLYEQGIRNAFITVGSVGNTVIRESLYLCLKTIGFTLPNLIDPMAIVSPQACLGEGIFIGKGAIVNVDSNIQNMAIINTGALIEHECSIGQFSHISSSATLCGNVEIGDYTHIGANATVIQGKKIGANCMVGAGSVVTKDFADHQCILGIPAKERIR